MFGIWTSQNTYRDFNQNDLQVHVTKLELSLNFPPTPDILNSCFPNITSQQQTRHGHNNILKHGVWTLKCIMRILCIIHKSVSGLSDTDDYIVTYATRNKPYLEHCHNKSFICRVYAPTVHKLCKAIAPCGPFLFFFDRLFECCRRK